MPSFFDFSVAGPGALYVNEATPGTSRTIADPGKAYILLKSGTETGEAVVTAAFGNLLPGTVTIYVGTQPPSPFCASNSTCSAPLRSTSASARTLTC